MDGPLALVEWFSWGEFRISIGFWAYFQTNPYDVCLFFHPQTNAHLLVQLLHVSQCTGRPQIEINQQKCNKVHISPTSWISVPKLQFSEFRGWRWPPRTRVSRPVELEIIEAARLDYCTSAKVGPGRTRLRVGFASVSIAVASFVWTCSSENTVPQNHSKSNCWLSSVAHLTDLFWGPHFQTHPNLSPSVNVGPGKGASATPERRCQEDPAFAEGRQIGLMWFGGWGSDTNWFRDNELTHYGNMY